jgi:hypothetical protein
MDINNKEFQAFAAGFAVGYYNETEILNQIKRNPDYVEQGMPSQFNIYFKNGQLISDEKDNFFFALRMYGHSLIR